MRARVPGSPQARIASVSYLNARPLIWGLDVDPSIDLRLEVPARLLDVLQRDEADVALLPVIDYQRMDNLVVSTAGAIGCDGPTLTVRIFSPEPVEGLKRLACDAESHTSVALARVVLAERYGIRPDFIGLRSEGCDDQTARLLIGDKVVTDEPRGMPYQVDLGEAWKSLTGLPFVFAIWTGRADAPWEPIDVRLRKARLEGMEHVDEIVRDQGVPRGWPAAAARAYLAEYLKFEVSDRCIEAIRLFHELAAKHGEINRPVKPLRIVGR